MRKSEQNLNKLVSELTCDDPIKCQNARSELVTLGEGAVEHLIQALHHKNHWVHWEAAKALGQIASPRAISALIDSLENGDFGDRWVAAESLIRIGPAVITPLLTELFGNPQSTWLREGAHHVLSELRTGEFHRILKPVIKAIESSSPVTEVTIAAKKALDSLR